MRIFATIVLLCSATSIYAQPPQSFDVASIKPTPAGTRTRILIEPGGRFFAEGVSLKLLIATAWHLAAYQLSGGENWITNDAWTIEATADGVNVPAWQPPFFPQPIAARIQTLVNDRFALQSHHEIKDMPVYRLTIAKNGPKLKVTPTAERPENSMPPPGRPMAGPGALAATAITMQQFITLLQRSMDRPIIDKTGLTGYVDVKLQFTPDSAPTGDAPSIFTAIEEQLGLKLEPSREPIDILVIDSARKPTAN